jgi:uncharacterized protein YcbK (DUF882 family)
MLGWRKSADLLAAIATAAACVAFFARGLTREPRVFHSNGLGAKKGEPLEAGEPEAPPLLATLVQTHTEERVLLDRESPSSVRFDALLADRATATAAPLDPRLLALLRALAAKLGSPDAGLPSVELVSGFRSPKLNEMLRKKGHHVASHSQHSLGHAVDFRIVVPCGEPQPQAAAPGSPVGAVQGTCASCASCPDATALALDPRVVERAIRALGWEGGTGVYTLRDDWFVHADVGPNRTWYEGPSGTETGGMARGDR